MMFTLSANTLVMSIVSISMIVQGADPQDCITPKVTSCIKSYTNAIAAAGGDKNKICSAANTSLDCLTKVGTDCKVDPSSLSQAIAAAKQALSQYDCGSGNGAGSPVFNLVTMMSALTFYKLF
ncbi:Hypothetical predicted protein [Mytilus galloprovincialis]|uniref:Uncharacterized protein n=1 Tax=Mytilus galloprovincialis TaxID=29158 RepID=A0A8B6DMK9_MYTGA|nr:Hypothetical predicted protein [Mytilus galloprovincialis]